MDKLRSQENADYKQNRADMEQGLAGVKLALKVLREYYTKADKAHEAAQGAGEGIISLLEVIESDFTKMLAEIISTEESAAAAYDKQRRKIKLRKQPRIRMSSTKPKNLKIWIRPSRKTLQTGLAYRRSSML